jgi:hypothetical protein
MTDQTRQTEIPELTGLWKVLMREAVLINNAQGGTPCRMCRVWPFMAFRADAPWDPFGSDQGGKA